MRTKRRIALLLASAAALGVGLFAFTGSAAAAPPVVPSCTLGPNAGGSNSCATLRTYAKTPPFGTALEPAYLGVRVRSVFSPSSSETTSVKLALDEQISLNLTGLPACPSSELVGKNVAQAWEQCGPGADGSPASEGNAYLSTGLVGTHNTNPVYTCAASPDGCVSGFGSSVPDGGGAQACVMIFKGVDDNHITLYARTPVLQCDNPASHTGGTTTVLFTGTLTHQPTSSIYDTTLNVLQTQTANPALDDFYATLNRANVVRAKCVTRSPSAHRMQVTWDYTAVGDVNDTRIAAHACPH